MRTKSKPSSNFCTKPTSPIPTNSQFNYNTSRFPKFTKQSRQNKQNLSNWRVQGENPDLWFGDNGFALLVCRATGRLAGREPMVIVRWHERRLRRREREVAFDRLHHRPRWRRLGRRIRHPTAAGHEVRDLYVGIPGSDLDRPFLMVFSRSESLLERSGSLD